MIFHCQRCFREFDAPTSERLNICPRCKGELIKRWGGESESHMESCADCPERDKCREPCEWLEAELEKATSPQTECLIGSVEDMDPHGPTWSSCLPHDMLLRHLLVMQLHEDGLSLRQIEYHTGFTNGWVYQITKKYRTSTEVQEEIDARFQLYASQVGRGED